MNSLIEKTIIGLPKFKRVVVGLSGGADSVVLTHVLKEAGYEVIAAHLNHGIRDTAGKDEAFVKDLCKKWELKCIVKKTKIPKTGNLENHAREARYAFLEEVRKKEKADFIAVGHHFDDQIETVLMHMARGAGLRGRRGMMKRTGFILRPLLDIMREEIETYAKKHKLDFCTDEMNFDTRFDRSRLRQIVIPELKKNPEFIPSIRQLTRDATQKLEQLSKEATAWLKENKEETGFDRQAFNKLSKELRSEILIQLLGPVDLYQKTIDALVGFLETGETGKLMQVKGQTFLIQYDKILLNPKAPKAGLPKVKISEAGINWGNWAIVNRAGESLFVRSWKAGDKFQPSGMKGHKKLQDFFTDRKIPKQERMEIPVIVDENDAIIAVGNLRGAEGSEELLKRLQLTISD